MPGKEMLVKLYEYTFWANDRVLTAASRLSPAQLQAPPAPGQRSVIAALRHMLHTERLWRKMSQEHQKPPRPLQVEESLEDLRRQWAEEQTALLAFLTALPEEELDRSYRIQNSDGTASDLIIWQMLMHSVLHDMQHRSEIAAILTGFGQSPGDLDFIFYV